MRSRKTSNSNRGVKRTRIAPNLSSLNPHEEQPRRKRLRGGRGSGSLIDKSQFYDGKDDQFSNDLSETSNPFDLLPDDLMIPILGKVSATASSPIDLINILLVSKRFRVLGLDREVLKKAAKRSLWVRAKNWSESAHQFLTQCANAGNLEACHFLGMIHFYCLANHASGIELLERAAQGSHAGALYSLAIIYFNRSGSLEGGLHYQCDPRGAASLCVKSANLGNLDALREVAYCLQYGLGLPCHPIVAQRLLLRADKIELIKTENTSDQRFHKVGSLLSHYGFYEKMGQEIHAANKFMIEWWWLAYGGEKKEDGLNMCSNILCGRRETRFRGFGRCSGCRIMTYCSHACQEMHWKMEHASLCIGQNVQM